MAEEKKKVELSEDELDDVSGGLFIVDLLSSLFTDRQTGSPNSSCNMFEQDPMKPSRSICNNCKYYKLINGKFTCEKKQNSNSVSDII